MYSAPDTGDNQSRHSGAIFPMIGEESLDQNILSSFPPLTSWLHLTDRCNLRCDYCYLSHKQEDMSFEAGCIAVDATFRSALANGFEQVKLKYAGGEPLLRFPLILELHTYAEERARQFGIGLDGVILSNGTLLSETHISSLLSHRLRLMISLDGVDRYHDCNRPYAGGRGSSADVRDAIELALAYGLTPNISITVSGRNVDGLPEVVGWVLDHHLPFSINFYRENDLSASHQDLRNDEGKIVAGLLEAFRRIEENLPRQSLLASLGDRADLSASHSRTCGVGQNYLVFNTAGDLSKCHMQMGKARSISRSEDALAAVREDGQGLQNISVEDKEGCRDCQWRYWCAGGCPLATYRATGRYDVKSPNCNIYQVLFPAMLRLEGLRLLKYQDNPQVVEKIII